MVHYNCCRISVLARIFLFSLVSAVLFSPTAGCGGGGSPAQVSGILTDAYGAIIADPIAVLTLEGSDVVGSPDINGSFLLSADPGTYTLRGTYNNPDADIKLEGHTSVELTKGSTLELGSFTISNDSLEMGWDSYRQGQFETAEDFFQEYLNEVRSGQVHLGGSSALCGLGWARGRGLDDPVQGADNFHDAVVGWDGNLDGWVGYAACELGRMNSDGDFHFDHAINAITSAVDIPGEYTSSPTHDRISEIDLQAYRSLLLFLNGDAVGARNEALSIEQQVVIDGNRGSADAISVVLVFTE